MTCSACRQHVLVKVAVRGLLGLQRLLRAEPQVGERVDDIHALVAEASLGALRPMRFLVGRLSTTSPRSAARPARTLRPAQQTPEILAACQYDHSTDTVHVRNISKAMLFRTGIISYAGQSLIYRRA